MILHSKSHPCRGAPQQRSLSPKFRIHIFSSFYGSQCKVTKWQYIWMLIKRHLHPIQPIRIRLPNIIGVLRYNFIKTKRDCNRKLIGWIGWPARRQDPYILPISENFLVRAIVKDVVVLRAGTAKLGMEFWWELALFRLEATGSTWKLIEVRGPLNAVSGYWFTLT